MTKTDWSITSELDVRGMNCPLPLLKAKKHLTTINPGEIICVISTDPNSVRDFQAFARQTGNKLLSHRETGGEYHFFLERKKA